MSEVFISYSKEDSQKAELLGEVLISHGLSVWWDKKIPFGKSYDEIIESKLAEAKSILVLWSKTSINSHWVKDEANEAKDRNILLPILLGDVKIPLGFRMFQTVDLTTWNGENDHVEFHELLDNIRTMVGQKEIEEGNDNPDKKLIGTWQTDVFLMSLKVETFSIYSADKKVSSLIAIRNIPNNKEAKLSFLTFGEAFIEGDSILTYTDSYKIVEQQFLPDGFVEGIISQSMMNNKQKIIKISEQEMKVEGNTSNLFFTSNKISNDSNVENITKYLNLL